MRLMGYNLSDKFIYPSHNAMCVVFVAEYNTILHLHSVGVLVICVLVFTVFCIVCTVFFVLFHLCIFILICFVCTSVKTTATK